MKGTNNKGTHKPKMNQNTTHTLQHSKQNARHIHYDTANKTQDTYTMTQQTNTAIISHRPDVGFFFPDLGRALCDVAPD